VPDATRLTTASTVPLFPAFYRMSANGRATRPDVYLIRNFGQLLERR